MKPRHPFRRKLLSLVLALSLCAALTAFPALAAEEERGTTASAAAVQTVPTTGDRLGLWVALGGVAVLGLAAVVAYTTDPNRKR